MISSEVLNARSTITSWALLSASVVVAAISLLATLTTTDRSDLATPATIERAMHSATVMTLTFALVASLVSTTSDYRFGRIDQLLLTDPGGRGVVASKALVHGTVGGGYGVLGGAVALVGMRSFYAWKDVPIDLGAAEIVQPLVGSIVGCALFAVIGVGAGTAIRNQPAAIAGALFLLLVVQPPLLLGVPDVGRWLPGAAGLGMTLAPNPSVVTPVAGGVVLAAWSLVSVGVGLWRLDKQGAG